MEDKVPTNKRSNKVVRYKVKYSLFITVMICVFAVACLIAGSNGNSAYKVIVKAGYEGTQEQFIASIVGQETQSDTKTAYQLACENGYRESESVWLETLTGIQTTENGVGPYTLKCRNGYVKTLAEWLEEIAYKPEKLGISNGGEKTDYELVCAYGYSGSFIEWLISVANDRVL